MLSMIGNEFLFRQKRKSRLTDRVGNCFITRIVDAVLFFSVLHALFTFFREHKECFLEDNTTFSIPSTSLQFLIGPYLRPHFPFKPDDFTQMFYAIPAKFESGECIYSSRRRIGETQRKRCRWHSVCSSTLRPKCPQQL